MSNITFFNLQNLYGRVGSIRKKIDEPFSDIGLFEINSKISDLANEAIDLQGKAKDNFSKASLNDLNISIETLAKDIESLKVEKNEKDNELLEKIHVLAYQIDNLILNFFSIAASDIEEKIYQLDEMLDEIKSKKAFNSDFFTSQIENQEKKLKDVHFRYDFPIVEELDEKQESYASRLIQMSKDEKSLKENKDKINFLTNLANIAKMYLYFNEKKADKLFEKLDINTKEKISFYCFRHTGKTIDRLGSDKKEVIASLLMHFIENEINNG